LYAGLRNTNWARSMSLMFFGRRLIFIILLIFFELSPTKITIYIMLGFQLAYLGIVITVKPYEYLSDNVVDITNEVFFTGFVGWFLHFNSRSSWSSKSENAFIGLMMLNSLVIVQTILATFIVKCVKMV